MSHALRPAAHLLKTLAIIPPGSRVLELGCGSGRHTVPLVRLGFDVHASDPGEDAVAVAREEVAAVDREAAARVRKAPLAPLAHPDAFFDWVVAYGALPAGEEAAQEVLREVRRVLKPGAWVYVALGCEAEAPEWHTPEGLAALMARADLAEAEAPARTEAEGERVVRGIYRRVEADTPR